MKRYILFFLCLIVLAGCGADGGSAPPGSSISMTSPASVTNSNTDVQTESQILKVTVTDSEGDGVRHAKISIKFVFTSLPDQNIISDFPSVVTLCDGTRINNPVDRETDDWGVYNLCISYQTGGKDQEGNGGLSYTGEISVLTGDLVATASLSVN